MMYCIQRIDENGTVVDEDVYARHGESPMSRDVAEWRRTLLASRSTDTFILVPVPDSVGGEE